MHGFAPEAPGAQHKLQKTKSSRRSYFWFECSFMQDMIAFAGVHRRDAAPYDIANPRLRAGLCVPP